MDTLLGYLVEKYNECPHDLLLHSYFQMIDGNVVSPMLTVEDDGGLYEAKWDEKSGILALGARHNPEGVRVQTSSSSACIWARLGERDRWQKIRFSGVSNQVMGWLLDVSPEGRTTWCASPHGEFLRQAGLCMPITRKTYFAEDHSPADRETARDVTMSDRLRTAEVGTSYTDKWKLWPLLLIVSLIAVIGLMVLSWHLGGKRRSVEASMIRNSDHTPVLNGASVNLPRVVPNWEDGPMIEL